MEQPPGWERPQHLGEGEADANEHDRSEDNDDDHHSEIRDEAEDLFAATSSSCKASIRRVLRDRIWCILFLRDFQHCRSIEPSMYGRPKDPKADIPHWPEEIGPSVFPIDRGGARCVCGQAIGYVRANWKDWDYDETWEQEDYDKMAIQWTRAPLREISLQSLCVGKIVKTIDAVLIGQYMPNLLMKLGTSANHSGDDEDDETQVLNLEQALASYHDKLSALDELCESIITELTVRPSGNDMGTIVARLLRMLPDEVIVKLLGQPFGRYSTRSHAQPLRGGWEILYKDTALSQIIRRIMMPATSAELQRDSHYTTFMWTASPASAELASELWDQGLGLVDAPSSDNDNEEKTDEKDRKKIISGLGFLRATGMFAKNEMLCHKLLETSDSTSWFRICTWEPQHFLTDSRMFSEDEQKLARIALEVMQACGLVHLTVVDVCDSGHGGEIWVVGVSPRSGRIVGYRTGYYW